MHANEPTPATPKDESRPGDGHRPGLTLLATLIATLCCAAPAPAADTDGDGLTDAEELALAGGTGCPDPTNADSDGDTLSDGDEVNTYLTDPCDADTDGDMVSDEWEILGVPYTDGAGQPQRYVLPGVTVNPWRNARHKNVYLEVDHMQGQHIPIVITRVWSWFVSAPVTNPDGATGIDLVYTSDDLGLPNATWTYNPAGGVVWPPEFASFKMSWFGTAAERANPDWYGPGGTSGPMREAKLSVFRYAVYAERLGTTSIGGLGEYPGNDLIVTLQGWGLGQPPLPPAQQQYKEDVYAAALMHELGHTLGLGHGGPYDNTNFEPNYHSVMNYSWFAPRYVGYSLFPTAAQVAYGASWSLDFSRSAFPNLTEGALNETVTSMCGGCTGAHAAHVVPVGPVGPWGWGYLESESGAMIDLNRNGIVPDAGMVAADLNFVVASYCSPVSCDDPQVCPRIDTCPLTGADDWSGLDFTLSGANFATGAHGAVLPAGEEISSEIVRTLGFVGGCGFADDFDVYEPNAWLDGRIGWSGWNDDPAFAAPVTGVQARSNDQAVEIGGASDLVHEVCADDFGAWSYSAWQYIPSDFASGGADFWAGSYFMLLNTYQIDGPYDWSIQVQFDANDGLMKVYHGDGANSINLPYETDRWVKIQSIVDLEDDWTQIYYDDELVTEYPWTGGIFGEGTGALDVAAVDLYANGSTSVFYDDLRFEPVASGCGSDLDIDADGDSLTLREEFLRGTDPCQSDTDEDGLPDGFDNCPLAFNPDQLDANGNGIGDACDEPGGSPCAADLDGNGTVGFADLSQMLAAWGPCPGGPCPADLDGNGVVGFADLNGLLAQWGPCVF